MSLTNTKQSLKLINALLFQGNERQKNENTATISLNIRDSDKYFTLMHLIHHHQDNKEALSHMQLGKRKRWQLNRND